MSEKLHDLPFDDRGPDDGALFTLDYLYLVQGVVNRLDWVGDVEQRMRTVRTRIRFIDLALTEEPTRDQVAEMSEPYYKDWRFYLTRHMTDEELREERRRLEDFIYRGLGAIAIGTRTPRALRHRLTGPGPMDRW